MQRYTRFVKQFILDFFILEELFGIQKLLEKEPTHFYQTIKDLVNLQTFLNQAAKTSHKM